MALQGRTDFNNYPLVLGGNPVYKDSETILTDAARAAVLKRGTVMAQVAASRKWVPLTDLTKTDGTAIARGVFMGDDIAAATLVAGDVTGQPIIVYGGGAIIDAQQLVLENSLTLNSVRAATTVNASRIEDDLINIGIMTVGTYDVDLLENA